MILKILIFKKPSLRDAMRAAFTYSLYA